MDIDEIGAEFILEMDREFHNSPDRVIAIVGAAYLDAMLDRLFRAMLIDASDEVEKLLRPDGPIGSNGSRCQLAFCLGLITRDQRDDLRQVAKIRNRFAHDFKATGFDKPPIKDICASLKQPAALAAMPEKLFSPEIASNMSALVRHTTSTARDLYQTTVIALFVSLFRRLKYVQRVSSIEWFSYDPDALSGPQEHNGV
jgi:DNA-binding MltR family transcriptional regulator